MIDILAFNMLNYIHVYAAKTSDIEYKVFDGYCPLNIFPKSYNSNRIKSCDITMERHLYEDLKIILITF